MTTTTLPQVERIFPKFSELQKKVEVMLLFLFCDQFRISASPKLECILPQDERTSRGHVLPHVESTVAAVPAVESECTAAGLPQVKKYLHQLIFR
jgi:hypothetical protein